MKRTLIALLLVTSTLHAEVTLPKFFGSEMVLQRETDAAIWGWAEPDEAVTITSSWHKTPVSIKADAEGRWFAKLPTGKAGGPHTITIEAANRITLKDVLFGEVWLDSGQSNMEMPMAAVSGAYTGVKDWQKELADSNHAELRLFQVGNFASKEKQKDVQAGISVYGVKIPPCKWQKCSPESLKYFSSTAYFFARHLHRELGVPIGVIDASWGGTPIEAWIGAEHLAKAGFDKIVTSAEKHPDKPNAQNTATRLYNGMIAPLMPFTIKGAIWYQGESNSGRPETYKKLKEAMLADWRDGFESHFSFYYVQISPFGYRRNAAYLREQQFQALSVEKTGMAVTMDIGNLKDIHPKNKQEVGRRLALCALAKDYDKKIAFSGPVYKDMKIKGDKIHLRFDHVGSGLSVLGDGDLQFFEIAGEDKTFVKATALIDGDKVIVESADVKKPVAVRYAFKSKSTASLMNKDGLPASSFRTDDWK